MPLMTDDEVTAYYTEHLAARGLRRVPIDTPRARSKFVPAPLTGTPVLVWTLPLPRRKAAPCQP